MFNSAHPDWMNLGTWSRNTYTLFHVSYLTGGMLMGAANTSGSPNIKVTVHGEPTDQVMYRVNQEVRREWEANARAKAVGDGL